MEGKWLSVLEFASYKKKSISTVRRYIKADRVKHKEDNGKYFIWAKGYSTDNSGVEKNLLEVKFELERVKKENIEIKNEMAEMKMLIELYENGQMLQRPQLPELPLSL
jgi:hypothetical protein